MIKDRLTKIKKLLGINETEQEVVDTPINEQPINEDIEIDLPDNIDLFEITELETDITDKIEMDAEYDEGYLEYSAEVVGFENRELQWNAYRTIISYTGNETSFIDFGCGRGDFVPFYMSEYEQAPNYIGVDMNEPLINTGRSLYPEAELILSDWFSLDETIQRDWAINVGSCNLRYDGNTMLNDVEYTKESIRKMYLHATTGVIVMLASNITNIQDGLVEHNPGEILNWAQQEFGNVAIDHSIGADVFCLIIYK